MNRRQFMASAVLATAGGPALVGQNCGPLVGYPFPGFKGCIAEVDINAAIREQDCDEFCWAACMQMIFALNGHELTQKSIVQQALRIPNNQNICAAIGGSKNYESALSKMYVDRNGDRFSVTLKAFFDSTSGKSSINNRDVVDAISAGRPLIYCNATHAMVNYKMMYKDGPQGIVPGEVWVVDPWPTNIRKRPLSVVETRAAPLGVMTFVADVIVS